MAISDRIAAVTRARPKLAVTQKAEDERRFARRKSGVVAGLMAYHPVKPPVACVIRDMSATGARLEVVNGWGEAFNSAEDVPDTFTLLIRHDKVEVDCEVMWRRTRTVGVRFTGSIRSLARRIASRNVQPATVKK